jgi:hypothetical protein
MKTRLPVLSSATALVVAVLGSTPVGNAAGDLLQKVPPFAKRATYASKTVIAYAACPSGKKVVGGGGHHASGVGFVAALASSMPAANTGGTAWQAVFKNLTTTPATVWAYAVCATVAP